MTRTTLLLGFALTGVAPMAWAGPAFFAGKLADGRLTATPEAGSASFAVLYSTISAEVGNGLLQVREETRIAGPDDGSVTTVVVIPLPADVRAEEVSVSVDGALPEEGRFLDEKAARQLFESVSEATGSSRILSRSGRPAWVIPRVELGARADVVVELRVPLRFSGGMWLAEVPMPAADLARGPARRVRFDATLSAPSPLRAVFSPTHEIEVERKGPRTARLRMSAEEVRSGDDLRLLYAVDDAPLGLRVLSHRLPDEDSGYFLVVGNPGVVEEKAEDKDLLLVVDTSGSMRGEKLEQARAAVEYCLEHLGPGDRFNLITFGTEVRALSADLEPTRRDRLDAAREFLDETVARGRTNIGDALARALKGAGRSNRPRIMIFVTDGAPTAGELDPDRIVASLPKLNTSGTRVFALGIGHDVDTHLLDRLSGKTGGSSEYVDVDEDLDVKVASLYDRVRQPVLADVRLDFGGLETHEVLPETIPTLFAGQELFVLGRYEGGGTHEVTLSGTRRGATTEHRVTATFPEQADADHGFVASLWAARRVGDLLRRLRLDGRDEALIEEVVGLCRDFGILTEYTDFLAQGDGPVSDADSLELAATRLQDANVHSSGGWAVRQAGNERALQQRKVSGDRGNRYVDRTGKRKDAVRMRQVGRKTFYKRGERWIQGGQPAKPAASAKRVKRFSREYFDLVNRDDDFAKAQALDEPMVLEVQGQAVEVY